MRTLFINLQLRPDSKRRQLPVGLAYVMEETKNSGFDFDLLDMDINDIPTAELPNILSDDYDVYAMGTLATGYKQVKEVSSIIRKINPNAVIVVGNTIATSIPEFLLLNTDVDVAVIGEGEQTFARFLNVLMAFGYNSRFEATSTVPGLAYKDADGSIRTTGQVDLVEDMDDIGFPNWSMFDLEKYGSYGTVNANDFSGENIISFPLSSARGCPYNCGFCYHAFKGRRYRKCSVGAVIGEIKRLKTKYGATFISFWDDITFLNRLSVRGFIAGMQVVGDISPIPWEANTRAGSFTSGDVSLLRDLRECGCRVMGFSLENASPEILHAMRKDITVDAFIEQANAFRRAGITPVSSVIFGYPQETRESIRATIDACRRAGIYPSVGYLLPLPGTEIYQDAIRMGRITDEARYLEGIGDRQDLHINLTQMEDNKLIGTVQEELGKLAQEQGVVTDDLIKTVKRQRPNNAKS